MAVAAIGGSARVATDYDPSTLAVSFAEKLAAPPKVEPSTWLKRFQTALEKGDVAAVQALIESKPKGFNIDVVMPKSDPANQNALQFVIAQQWSKSTLDMVKTLVESGHIDLAHLDASGKSAFQEAIDKAHQGGGGEYQSLARYLQDKMNAELWIDLQTGNGPRAKALEAAGAVNPNDQTKGQGTNLPVHNPVLDQQLLDAASKGDLETVDALLANQAQSGLDINAEDEDGNNALQLALMVPRGDYSLVQLETSLMNSGIDLTHKNKAGQYAIDLANQAFRSGNHFGREQRDGIYAALDDRLAQSVSSQTGEDEAIALVKAGASGTGGINGTGDHANDMSILQAAVLKGQSDLAKAIVDSAAVSSERAGMINAAWADGNTAMHMAALTGQTELYTFFKSHGGDDTIKNDVGQSPDALLSANQKRFLDPLTGGAILIGSAAYLIYSGLRQRWGLESGGDRPQLFPTYTGAGGSASTHRPGTTGQNGSTDDPEKESNFTGLSGLAKDILDGDERQAVADIRAGDDPKGSFMPGISYLTYAASAGEFETVQALIEATPEADRAALINLPGVNGLTAMHAAAYSGNRTIYDYLKSQGGDETVRDSLGLGPKEALADAENTIAPRGLPGDFPYKPGGGQNRNALRNWFRSIVQRNTLTTGTSSGPAIALSPAEQTFIDVRQRAQPLIDELNRLLGPAFGGNLPVAWIANRGADGQPTGAYTLMIGNLRISNSEIAPTPGFSFDSNPPLTFDAQTYIQDRLEDVLKIAQNPVGLQFLSSQLSRSPGAHPFVIAPTTSQRDPLITLWTDNPSNTRGTPIINFNPAGLPNAEDPAGTPSYVALFHEMLHVSHSRNGAAPPELEIEVRDGIEVSVEEAVTTGLGPWANAPITENSFRAAENLPRRDYYSDPNEIDPVTHLWGGMPVTNSDGTPIDPYTEWRDWDLLPDGAPDGNGHWPG